jgi:hypothetical protein
VTGWDGGDRVDPVTELEAANALRQYDSLVELIGRTLVGGERIVVVPGILCDLNHLAVDGLVDRPGQYRDGPVTILGSRHEPPPHEEVPQLVDEMCSAINGETFSGIDRAAYALWRINWIHPFADGNGRTARAVAYFLICQWLEVLIPGRQTLPERIANEKRKYVRCLEEADQAWKRRKVVNVADAVRSWCGDERAAVKAFKRHGGFGLLSKELRTAAETLASGLRNFGIFVIERGELESWLPQYASGGHGPTWLIPVFERMRADPTAGDYVRPTSGDVWDFVRAVSKWLRQ